LEQDRLNADSICPSRFSDHGELRYALRALDQFAPWVRKIFLVTNGQVPDWLDCSSDRVTIVCHDELFPDRNDLPTFNSHAIELHLHRIPGLSEHYLYFNDDVFLGSPVAPDDFNSPLTGQRIYFEDWGMPFFTDGSTLGRALTRTQQLLNARYGENRKWRAIAHTPQIYKRSILQEVEGIWAEDFRRTSRNRFRAADDVALRVLYYHVLVEDKRYRCFPTTAKEPATYVFFRLGANPKRARQRLGEIVELRPKFFCLNDDLGADESPEAAATSLELASFLEAYFPNPSRFEKPSMAPVPVA
jgi:hypothetical protein